MFSEFCKVLASSVFVAIAVTSSVAAADLTATLRTDRCLVSPESTITSLPAPEFRALLERNYDIAKSEMKSPQTIYSQSTRFIWADEAKIQCSVALGYLKGGHRDEESAQKCDCFTQHLAQF